MGKLSASTMDESTNSFKLLKITNLGWSQSRSTLPALLAEAGVPEEVWHRTFDAAIQHQESMTKQTWYWWQQSRTYRFALFSLCSASLWVAVFWPPFFFFAIPALIFVMFWEAGNQHERKAALAGWATFANTQNDLYLTYGVRVKMLRVLGKIQPKIVMGGLLFQKMANCPNRAKEGTSTSGSLIQDLESLHNLHQSGALTDEEYSKAKGAVLASANQDSTDTAQFQLTEGVQEVIHAKAVAVPPAEFNPIYETSFSEVEERKRLNEEDHAFN